MEFQGLSYGTIEILRFAKLRNLGFPNPRKPQKPPNARARHTIVQARRKNTLDSTSELNARDVHYISTNQQMTND